MTDCDHLIDDLNRLARDQVELALIARVPPIAAMHIDLAVFEAERARVVEELYDDG